MLFLSVTKRRHYIAVHQHVLFSISAVDRIVKNVKQSTFVEVLEKKNKDHQLFLGKEPDQAAY